MTKKLWQASLSQKQNSILFAFENYISKNFNNNYQKLLDLRTKSGKIVELAVNNIIEGNNIKNKEALANPEALEQFKNLKELSN